MAEAQEVDDVIHDFTLGLADHMDGGAQPGAVGQIFAHRQVVVQDVILGAKGELRKMCAALWSVSLQRKNTSQSSAGKPLSVLASRGGNQQKSANLSPGHHGMPHSQRLANPEHRPCKPHPGSIHSTTSLKSIDCRLPGVRSP